MFARFYSWDETYVAASFDYESLFTKSRLFDQIVESRDVEIWSFIWTPSADSLFSGLGL